MIRKSKPKQDNVIKLKKFLKKKRNGKRNIQKQLVG